MEKRFNECFNIEGCKVTILDESHVFDIQNLCERCKEYFILDQGTGPSINVGKEILEALPPQLSQSEKYLLGIYNNEKQITAMVDLLKNYPTMNEWMLGLMLIDPEERGLGLGKVIHESLSNWIKYQNGEKIRIGILDNNHRAIKFWSKIGYVLVKKSELERDGKENRYIFNMDYYL